MGLGQGRVAQRSRHGWDCVQSAIGWWGEEVRRVSELEWERAGGLRM
jgi:hypothetical protein